MNRERKSIICRICCADDPKIRRKCISLFDKHNYEYLISENISSITNVKIQEGDGLPSKICPDCLLELNGALNFKSKCESSNVLLQNTLLNTHTHIKKKTKQEPIDIIKKEELEENEEYFDADFFIDDTECLNESNELPNSEFVEPDEIKEVSNAVDNKLAKAIDLKLECNECGGSFKSKCKLRVHWKKVHMYESMKCKICMRAFKSYKAYNVHVKFKSQSCITASMFRIELVGKSRVFHCKKCAYSSKQITAVNYHYLTHTGDKPHICRLCSKRYTQRSALLSHQERAHQMYKVITNCQYCGKHLKGRDLIYKHMKQHRSDKFQCDLCRKMFKSKDILIVHLKRHTGVKSYTCEICGQSFYISSDLATHRRTIHERGKHIYKCNLCEFKATNAPKIKKHKSGHTKTNIPCLVCGIFVEGAKQLELHQRRHFGVRNYECSFCDKKFLHRSARSRHTLKLHKTLFLLDSQNKNNIKKVKIKS